ncbi:MAG: hypothetical protein J5I93_04790 [Pirellulaceae bacterium]|nr:hypothetical protein [Pirellulaceae bacterium]
MHHAQPAHATHTYLVRVGHAEVRVEGQSEQDALRRARRQLCEEMPRLWDVIQSLDDSRFQITREAP